MARNVTESMDKRNNSLSRACVYLIDQLRPKVGIRVSNIEVPFHARIVLTPWIVLIVYGKAIKLFYRVVNQRHMCYAAMRRLSEYRFYNVRQ